MNIQKDWKAKFESAYSFMLKYSKITEWNDYYQTIMIDMYFEKENIWLKVNL